MLQNPKLKIMLITLVFSGLAAVTYFKLDTLSLFCYNTLEKAIAAVRQDNQNPAKSEPDDANGQNFRTGTNRIGKPADKAVPKSDSDRRRTVVSRDGKASEFWLRGPIQEAYNDVGGANSILGSPTSNEYKWKGGIRQDFERGHWLYWSSETGVKLDYNPSGRLAGNLSELQSPVFLGSEPAVRWTRNSKNSYFITQDFGENGHLGQDLGLTGNPDPGYDIRPITDGLIVFSGWTGHNSYGYCVLIRHSINNGRYFYSQYSHLHDTPYVYTGQRVNTDTVLGRIGDTGKSTGPHLDLQIKEIPQIDSKKVGNLTLSDLGYGYTPGHRPFEGNIYYDSRTGQTYYKPSYVITSYKNNPGRLMEDFRRIIDLRLPFRNLPVIETR